MANLTNVFLTVSKDAFGGKPSTRKGLLIGLPVANDLFESQIDSDDAFNGIGDEILSAGVVKPGAQCSANRVGTLLQQ